MNKDVKNYYRDQYHIEVGDPYEEYTQENKTIPASLTRLLVRKVNIYVSVYDDTCFNFCNGTTKDALRRCSDNNCSPMAKDSIKVTVECDTCERQLEDAFSPNTSPKSIQTKDGFGNVSNIPSGNNMYLYVRVPGMYHIRCFDEGESSSSYIKPDEAHKR